MARVLVLRAQPGADETAARVRAFGHEALTAPLTAVERLPAEAPTADGVLLTSAHGARCAPRSALALPALCVGEATASAARAAGFADVQAAGGDGAALVALAREQFAPGARLLHVAGEEVATDVSALLAAAGYEARRILVYRVVDRALTAQARACLDAGDIEAALLHSARAGRIFETQADPAGLAALCLSARVAAALDGARWRQVRVAAEPNDEALLALLGPPARLDGAGKA